MSYHHQYGVPSTVISGSQPSLNRVNISTKTVCQGNSSLVLSTIGTRIIRVMIRPS